MEPLLGLVRTFNLKKVPCLRDVISNCPELFLLLILLVVDSLQAIQNWLASIFRLAMPSWQVSPFLSLLLGI